MLMGVDEGHRDKISDPLMPSACVSRPVSRKEILSNAQAAKAMQVEWDRLRKISSWDESLPREWDVVAREARLSGKEVHMGMIFGFVVEENSDLPPGDPRRKYKGRVVFQGNNVKNQNWEAAVFADLGSAPSSMEAGRVVDAFGLQPGYSIQQSDAVQAYLQAELRGNETWVLLPRDQWPESWSHMRKPVCRLRVALYGHPDSGTDWEAHCSEKLTSIGLQEIGKGAWPSCFYLPALKIMLSVYVDDFKMAGPEENLNKGGS